MWLYLISTLIFCYVVWKNHFKHNHVIKILSQIGVDVYDDETAAHTIIDDIDIVCYVDTSKVMDEFLKGSIGFMESYMAGWWSCNDLKGLLEKLNNANLDTAKQFTPLDFIELGIKRMVVEIKGFSRVDNELVALQHYDLPLTLYKEMLDPTMSYSCGYFKNTDNLEDAQLNKINLIINKMHLEPGMKVLDIGCGWGSLAHNISKQYNVEVIGVTISKEQYHYCCEEYTQSNLYFELSDYRDIEGKFDRIVSVGMFEHVTSKNYSEFFDVCQRLLKPKGLILLHTITGNKSHRPGEGNAFITKYIFPNSQLPSLSQIMEASSHKFITEDVHNFGLYYAKTLEQWYKNFDIDIINQKLAINGKDELTPEFIRMWRAYLLISQIGFESRKINLHQFVLSRGQTEVYDAVR